jgi:hypothetical protein
MSSLSSRTLAIREQQPLPEPVIQCPHCQGDIKLTESLAAPFIRAREAEFKRQEAGLRDREAALRRDRESIERQVAEQVATERKKLEEEAQRRARLALGTELEANKRELAEAKELLKLRDEKLAEAQRAQAGLIRKQREVEEAAREIELTVEKRVSASVGAMRIKARQEAEDELKLKVTEKDQVIQSMQRQIEELRRKAEQGSQQLQGEVQEAELESLLGSAFVFDTITRVPKGEFGGDVLHRVVMNQTGAVCGTILWESKRTKSFSDSWLAKLRQDMRTAKADIAVIVSQALPNGVKHFALIDGVYVVSPQCVRPVAEMLRGLLIEVAGVRQAAEGRETKAAVVYQYLTGARFKQHMQAIVEAFTTMQEDLGAEKKVMMKQWAKREMQIERVIGSTAGLYGDLQGIVGKAVGEMEGLVIINAVLPAVGESRRADQSQA